ncbi:MAG: glutaredoxin family protein [Mycoplasmoidaceae bacterium]
MYLFIYKDGCISCEKAKKLFTDNHIRFREVNCSSKELSIEDIEILKTAPGNNLSTFINKKHFYGRVHSISRAELKEMYDDFAKYGNFPIIVKYNFLNQIENYMIGYLPKILLAWFQDDSIAGQYVNVNDAFRAKECCYLCDKKHLSNKLNLENKSEIQSSIKKLENLKSENNLVFEKYLDDSKKLHADDVNHDDDLIMATKDTEYEKPLKTASFNFKKESTSTIEIPIFSDLVFEDGTTDDGLGVLRAFKEKMRKLGKNKFSKDQEFVVEHINSVKEEFDLASELQQFEEPASAINQPILKNINQLEEDLANLNESLSDSKIEIDDPVENLNDQDLNELDEEILSLNEDLDDFHKVSKLDLEDFEKRNKLDLDETKPDVDFLLRDEDLTTRRSDSMKNEKISLDELEKELEDLKSNFSSYKSYDDGSAVVVNENNFKGDLNFVEKKDEVLTPIKTSSLSQSPSIIEEEDDLEDDEDLEDDLLDDLEDEVEDLLDNLEDEDDLDDEDLDTLDDEDDNDDDLDDEDDLFMKKDQTPINDEVQATKDLDINKILNDKNYVEIDLDEDDFSETKKVDFLDELE